MFSISGSLTVLFIRFEQRTERAAFLSISRKNCNTFLLSPKKSFEKKTYISYTTRRDSLFLLIFSGEG